MPYEMVVGLETHVELATKTKIFCGCTTAFGGEPNTHCCPVCIGLPGTLPRLNRQAVEYAILAGLATGCEISPVSMMDRKNYVYPDLAKAYQISQYDRPLCQHGCIELESGRKIRILRIHIEEDAGKLVHRQGVTLVDYNRAGVPLIEIVTEPDIRSIEEAAEYLEKLQLLLRAIGVSDCRMEEGSLRCDVNISVRPAGSEALGTRAEIKNMNSFTFMRQALAFEFERQTELLEAGQPVVQETRRFDTASGETEPMRSKEDAHDYRYFREPDLPPIVTTPQEVERLRALLPELPQQRYRRYTGELGLAEEDARLLSRYRRVAEYFDAALHGPQSPRGVAHLLLGPVFRRYPTEAEKEAFAPRLPAAALGELTALQESGRLSPSLARSTLERMLDTGRPAGELLSAEDLSGLDDDALRAAAKAALAQNPKAVQDVQAGKQKAMGALVGSVMKATRGRADPRQAEALLRELLGR